MTAAFKNFIAAQWVEPATGAYVENRNPADWNRDLIGRFPRSGAEDVASAAASARRGFRQWSRTPAPVRGQVLQRIGDLLVRDKERLAQAMTREMGKVLLETRGDVQEGIDTAYYAHTEGRRLFGRTVPSELRNKWAMTYRRPIGVAGIITPFNFPLAVPTWKIFPALLSGNAVIWKPSEDVPHTATLLVELLLVSGFRSVGYQADLIRRKLASGQDIDAILRVNAAPGFSEHHTGRAVDVATPGTRPLTEAFASSATARSLLSTGTLHGGRGSASTANA